jgi:triosephosphate isomerase
MSRKKLLAGNWKMFKTNAELGNFFETFASQAAPSMKAVDVLFAVPYTLLANAQKLASKMGILVAAQNVHFEKSGAYTGEISIPMLLEIGVKATLIGHSERRQYFAETDATVTKKTLACLEAGILPIVCVGETKQERETGKTTEVVTRQVMAVLSAVKSPANMVIAYEPVWAIGTGLTATSQQAQEVHALIRKLVSDTYGPAVAASMRILYGGSVKPSNVGELVSQPDIDGGLVGGASLNPAEFAELVKTSAK